MHNPYEPGRDWGLALLRIVVAIVFIAHGGQKLFVLGIEGVTQGFGQMGLPFPAFTAPLVICVEFFGGLALLLGFFTRWVAIPLAITMLGAMFLVHLRNGFFLPTGFEYTLVLFAALVTLLLTGPGALALDNRRGRSGGILG